MRLKSTQNEFPASRLASPYMVIAILVLVGLGITSLTYHAIQKNKEEYVRLYEDKGASLIRSVEAGVRTDLRSKNSTIRLKLLLDEMADRPEIFFIAITFGDGSIMQSTFTESQRRMEQSFQRRIKTLYTGGEISRSLLYDANNRKVFLAYREFSPLSKQELWRKLKKEPTLEPMQKFINVFKDKRDAGAAEDAPDTVSSSVPTTHDLSKVAPVSIPQGPLDATVDVNTLKRYVTKYLDASSEEHGQPVIYVGLDAKPLQDMQRASLVQSVVTSGSVFFMAVVGFISLYWAQRAQRSRRKAGRSKAIVEEVMYSLPDGLIVTDNNDQIVYMNELCRRLLRCDGEITAGVDAAGVLLPELVPLYLEAREGKLRAEHCIEVSTEDIPFLPLAVNGSAIKDDHGVTVGTVFLMKDMRELYSLQAEVQRKDKLAAIGSLAAGVAHEIRNPLSSIKGGATYLKTQFSAGSAGERTASIVIDEVERLNRVITDLIGLSRPSDLTLKPTDLRTVVEHCLGLIAQEAKLREVVLTTSLPEGLSQVQLDADRFAQVILNLCLNSLDAMDEGGALKVSAMQEGATLHCIVEDSGEGMDTETQERIFEPYFTTKSHGTGLGLSVVHKIIEAHNGIIRVFSRKGQGTRFVIQLPVSNGE